MTPEHDRRQRPPTSDTAGWHTLEFIVRQALEVQRDLGTASAVEFLRTLGINPQVIDRVLAPQPVIRAQDQQALASSVAGADLPVATARAYLRRSF